MGSYHRDRPDIQSTASMREFRVDKTTVLLMKVCLAVFLAFLTLGIVLPFLPDGDETNPNETVGVALLCIAVFGTFALLTWRFLRKLPFACIVIDDEGLWYQHLGKEKGLVPWERITAIRERVFFQRLDLLDARESRLIKVEYQLEDFESLRNLLQDRVRLTGIDTRRRSYSKSMAYHLFYAACIVGFSCLGIFLGSSVSPALVYSVAGLLVVVIAWEYAVTATGVDILDQALTISFPLRTRSVAFTDITELRMADSYVQGNRHPEVWVVTRKRKKPYKLKQMGVDANILFAVLHTAIKPGA